MLFIAVLPLGFCLFSIGSKCKVNMLLMPLWMPKQRNKLVTSTVKLHPSTCFKSFPSLSIVTPLNQIIVVITGIGAPQHSCLQSQLPGKTPDQSSFKKINCDWGNHIQNTLTPIVVSRLPSIALWPLWDRQLSNSIPLLRGLTVCLVAGGWALSETLPWRGKSGLEKLSWVVDFYDHS